MLAWVAVVVVEGTTFAQLGVDLPATMTAFEQRVWKRTGIWWCRRGILVDLRVNLCIVVRPKHVSIREIRPVCVDIHIGE